MRLRALVAGLVGSSASLAAPAGAAVSTIGSPLTADATIIEAHQQDSGFWAGMIGGTTFAVPADGQIRVIWLQGSVLREEGASDPLNGGPGSDVLLGGPGRDVINARDFSADMVRCGAGRDLVLADKRDLIGSDCERVRRR